MKFALGGKTLLTGSSDMTVERWDAFVVASLGNHSQEREQDTVALEGKGCTATINAMAFSPDGTMLALASDESTLLRCGTWPAANNEGPPPVPSWSYRDTEALSCRLHLCQMERH